jgi:hypothetical protein
MPVAAATKEAPAAPELSSSVSASEAAAVGDWLAVGVGLLADAEDIGERLSERLGETVRLADPVLVALADSSVAFAATSVVAVALADATLRGLEPETLTAAK